MQLVDSIVEDLQCTPFFHAFNPYTHVCEVYDNPDAPAVRTEILRNVLISASSERVESIWIGRDLGHRGGRRTGLALTDDYTFQEHLARWSVESYRPSKGEPIKERTASVIWDVLRQIDKPIFLWNVFPFHPHPPNKPLENRAHNASERDFGKGILVNLIHLLNPKSIVAIGNDATKVVHSLDLDANLHKARHPSFGGQSDFIRQVSEIYEIGTPPPQMRLN